MNESPIACVMNAMNDAESKRYDNLRQHWQRQIQSIIELEDGFALRFPPQSELLLALAEFITMERLCCSFLEFELVLEREGSTLWMRMRGREDVKEFLAAEFAEVVGGQGERQEA